jgi:hypothetical protein
MALNFGGSTSPFGATAPATRAAGRKAGKRGRKRRNPYPNTPPPLSSDDQAVFDTAARNANAALQRTQADVRNQCLAVRNAVKKNAIDIGYQKGTDQRAFGMAAGAQGQGWNPAFMAPGMTAINRDWARAALANDASLAEKEAALDALLQDARIGQRRVLDEIAAQKASVGAQVAGLIRGAR